MRRFCPDGSGQGGRVAGYPWNGYPNALNATQAHLGGNPFEAASFLAPCCVTAEGQGRSAELRPKPYGHWRLAFALPKLKMPAAARILLY
jgi:hypothetical protein